MDVSRNEESHVSVTTSLFMALVKVHTNYLLSDNRPFSDEPISLKNLKIALFVILDY